jgi:hypothetical protein
MATGSSPEEDRFGIVPVELQDCGEAPLEVPASLPPLAPVEIREFAAELVDFTTIQPPARSHTTAQSTAQSTAEATPPASCATPLPPAPRVGRLRRILRGVAWLVRTI